MLYSLNTFEPCVYTKSQNNQPIKIYIFKIYYKKVEKLLQLKRKGKIVKQIRTNDKILTKLKSMQKLTDFYSKIFNKSKRLIYSKIWNNEYNFEIDLNSAISKLSQKTPGLYHIPSEWLTSTASNNKFKLKLTNIFKEWVCKSEVPKFWMTGELILLNKDKNNHQLIENTWPITILPSITKMFELTIIHNLEK